MIMFFLNARRQLFLANDVVNKISSITELNTDAMQKTI
jgi:hypothetical protein